LSLLSLRPAFYSLLVCVYKVYAFHFAA
jgi:hypothetical protein